MSALYTCTTAVAYRDSPGCVETGLAAKREGEDIGISCGQDRASRMILPPGSPFAHTIMLTSTMSPTSQWILRTTPSYRLVISTFA